MIPSMPMRQAWGRTCFPGALTCSLKGRCRYCRVMTALNASFLSTRVRRRKSTPSLHRATPILFVPTLDLAARQRDDVDGRAGLPETVARHLEFGLVET